MFMVFFAGERARQKILKICEAFGANRYPFPEEFSRQRAMNAEARVNPTVCHTHTAPQCEPHSRRSRDPRAERACGVRRR